MILYILYIVTAGFYWQMCLTALSTMFIDAPAKVVHSAACVEANC